jgi:hypothetical protein
MELIFRGLVGPKRLYGTGSIYNGVTYAALAGAVLPIGIWLVAQKKAWARNINLPVALNGVLFIPPATGVNYASWLVVGAIFQFWVRRARFAWWSKVCLYMTWLTAVQLCSRGRFGFWDGLVGAVCVSGAHLAESRGQLVGEYSVYE